MVKDDKFENKWAAVVDYESERRIFVLHMCKIIDHSEMKSGFIYLGRVNDMLSYGIEPNTWDFTKVDDLSEWIFPVKMDQIFDTKQQAQRSLFKQLLSLK